MHTLKLPGYLQVSRDTFKSIHDCNYHEFARALMRERDPAREAEMNRLLAINGDVWREFPLMTVGEMTAQ